jgi:hypothetical protein
VTVPHLLLTWQSSLLVAALLGSLAVLFRGRRGRWWSFGVAASRETAIVLSLYALWQVAGGLALRRVTGAFDRAHAIFHIDRWLPLPSELTVQGWVLPHPDLVKAANVFYLYVHLNGIVLFLVWVFVRHRDRFPWVRNVLALSTALCLLVQLVPVAPPRMLTDVGFVDTALKYGQSVYGAFGSGIADQLSAMPSVHVGWSVLIAIVVIRISPSRWRWLIIAHPVLTSTVVVLTANHWWADGIVAALLDVAAILVVDRLMRRAAERGLAAGEAADEALVSV